MKIIYNMDELAKKLGTGKITSIVITDLCLCVECSEKPNKNPSKEKSIIPVGKRVKARDAFNRDKLSNFEKMMKGPSF